MLIRSLLNRSKNVKMAVRRSFSSNVMSFGDGSHGALGLPSSVAGLGIDAFEPTRVGSIPSEISALGAGHYHSLAVTSDGHLWAWGRDLEAQLGRGFSSPRDSWNEPRRVIGLDRVRVKAAFGSGVVSGAIGDDGSLWTWGKSKRGQLGLGKEVTEAVLPSKVEALSGENITKVSFGWGHALAQTEDGKLFGWGYSADGRLGNIGGTLEPSPLESNSVGNLRDFSSSTLEAAQKLVSEAMEKENNMPIVWEPCQITEIDGGVVDISCGLDHSLILCANGVLLSCGSNVYNQLGRSQQDLGLFPVNTSFRLTSIASGLGHSLATTEDECDSKSGPAGTLITWGWNHSSQLGRAGPESVPSKLERLETEKPISLCGGRAHSAALTAAGEVWVWGCGKNGRLGLGSSIDEPEPAFLDFLEGRRVSQVVAGFDHSLVLVDDGE